MKTNLSVNKWRKTFTLVIALGFLAIMAPAQTPGTGVVTVTANGGSCVAYTPAQSAGPDNWEVAEGGSYTMTITGVTECTGTITVFVQSSSSGNFCFDATEGSSGVFTGTFTLPTSACSTMPISYKCGAGQSCDNANTFDANGPSNTGHVHLRTSFFDVSCNRTGPNNCSQDLPPSIDCSVIGENYGCVTSAPPIPAASATDPVVDGGCEPVTVTWSTDVENVEGCVHTITRTYTATDNCQQSTSCDAVWTYSIASALVFDNLPSGGALSGCNPTPPSCDGGVTATNGCGIVNASCQAGDVTPDGCNRSQTFHYSATTSCGDGVEADVTYTWVVSTPVNVTADGPTTVCEGTCVTLTTDDGLGDYQWYNGVAPIDGATGSTLEICDVGTGSYSVSVTNSCGCSSSSDPITVTINANPSCSITDPCPVVNNMTGNTACAEVDCPSGDCGLTWSITSTNGSWSIPGSKTGTCVTFTSGAYVVNGISTNPHLHLEVVDNVTGCRSSCDLDISCEAERCAYTQGFYGNTNGTATCLGLSTTQAIYQALTVPTSAPIVVGGYNSKSLTINPTMADVACVICKLPGTGTPVVLPGVTTVCGATYPTWLTTNGTCSGAANQRPKFKSVVWGQALTLAINLRLFANLGNLRICTSGFTTYGVSVDDCSSIVYSDAQSFTIPTSVVSCLGGTCTSGANKISDLMVLANKKLCGVNTCSSVTLSNINDALNAVNVGFDRCRITLTGVIRLGEETASDVEAMSDITIYPNPSSAEAVINFVPVADGKATIDIYNTDGSLARSLFNDNVYEGSLYNVNFSTNKLAPGIYFVRVVNGNLSSVNKLVVTK